MQIRKDWRRWLLQRRIRNAIRMLTEINVLLKGKATRQMRKNFWRHLAYVPSKSVDIQKMIIESTHAEGGALAPLRRIVLVKKVRDAIRMCRRLDNAFTIAGYERKDRKQFWWSVSSNPDRLVDQFDAILKEQERKRKGLPWRLRWQGLVDRLRLSFRRTSSERDIAQSVNGSFRRG